MVLVVANQAQWLNYGYGLGGYGGFGGFYPFTGAQLATAYTGPQQVATAYTGLPAAGYPYYGYPSVTASKYHAQDELGQARFGYAHPGQAATNYRDAFGNQIGSYAYINPEGKEVRVSYTADSRGFRVASNDLPEAPVANLVQIEDTPEVAAAKAEHMAAINAAKSGVAAPAPSVVLPEPVKDTAEVAAAKADFAVKFAQAKAASAPIRSKRQVFSTAAAPLFAFNNGHVSPYAVNFPLGVVSAPVNPVREAILTKTILTPGHAVAYRVD